MYSKFSFQNLIAAILIVLVTLQSSYAQNNDSSIDSQKAECNKNSASEWSPILNRCVGKAEARQIRHEAQDCAKITDISQREQCHRNLATKLTGVAANPNAEGSTAGKALIMNGVNTAYAALTLINSYTSKTKSTCTSKMIFGATALAGVASDFFLKSKAKNKTEELTNKYKIDTKTSAHNAQIKAFEYLKDEQKTVEEVASMEKKRNMLLMLGYGAATGFALYEIMNPTTYAECNKPEGEQSQAADAAGGSTAPAAATTNPAATEAAASGSGISFGGVGSFFSSSKGVAVLAGISTVFSGMLYKAADEQEQMAKDNQKKIDQIIATFNDTFKYYCPNGRDTLDEPNCYCYTDDGSENPNRTRSQICQDLWAKNKFKYGSKSDSYAGVAKFSNPVGCVNTFGQFDELCSCKKFLDNKGNNSCKKVSNIEIPNTNFGKSFGSNSGLQDVMKFANNSFNGNPNFSNFSTAALLKQAVNAKKMNEKIASKLQGRDGKIEGMPFLNEDNIIKYSQKAFGEKTLASAESKFKSALSAMSSNSLENTAFDQKTREAIKKTGLDLTGGDGIQKKKITSKENFNFNLSADGSNGNNSNAIQEFSPEQKSYKLKGDISKNSGISLFEIISNRYLNSGLRRLFEN